MKFQKKKRVGVSILCLLLIFTTSISLIDFDQKNNVVDENLLSISAPEDPYETRDGYANNNERANATDITFWEGNWLYDLDGGNGTQWDSDFYMIYIPYGYEHLKVNVTFKHLLGDINVRIRDEGGAVWNIGSMVPSGEFVDFSAQWAGIYYIEIYGDDLGNMYNLIWTTHPADDQFDDDGPNDEWYLADDITGYNWLYGRQFNNDWYNFTVDAGVERLVIDLQFYHFDGDINIEFYDNGSFTVPVLSSYSFTDNEYINYLIPNISIQNTYYIKILGSNWGNGYDLWIKHLPFDDFYEDNDDWINATDLSAPTEEDIWHWDLISNDDDWYKVKVDGGEMRLIIEVDHDNAQGYIEFDIYYYDNITPLNWIAWTDDSWWEMNVAREGEYYIHIYGDFAGNQYDLLWKDEFPYVLSDDIFEPNDSFEDAREIWPSYYYDLRIVNDNEDWFWLYLNSGELIDIYIYFGHWEGDLQLELYAPDKSYHIGSYSSDDHESLSYTVDISGDWRIKVYHNNNNSQVHYDLDILKHGGEEDPYEENNEPLQAFDLTSYEGWWLTMIMGEGRQFDMDWYRFDIGEGVEELRIELNFDQWEGNIYIELLDGYNTPLGQIQMSEGYVLIEVKNPLSGRYYIRVDGDNNGNWYDLYWTAGAEVIWGDDAYEMNNDMWEAYRLWDDEQTWLSDVNGLAVQGDDDWYMIDITPRFTRVFIELEFNFSLGDINLALYNDNQNLIAENTTDKNIISINATVQSWGEYYIRIWGDGAENEYDLWWDDIRTDFREDAYEENDNFINATDLSFRENQEIVNYLGFGVQYDQDWFEIFVTPEKLILIVEVYYDSAEGLMGFEVYDDGLRRIIGNFTMEDDDFILYRLRSNGTYYIKVFGDNTGNVYNLLWKTKEDIPIEDIPGYDIFILLGSVFGVASIVVLKLKRSKLNRK